MNPLLEWGLGNSTASDREMIDPNAATNLLRENRDLMEQLMKSDAIRMKEQLANATNKNLELEDRELALDELEMLVESIDNANDLATIKGIPPLLSLLEDPEPLIQLNAAWVLGTCAQNNARFTKNFLDENGLEALVTLLRKSTHAGVHGKLVYAISGCIRSSTEATARAIALNLFETLLGLLSSPSSDLNLKRKLVFFFGGIIFEQHSHEELLKHLQQLKLYDALIADLQIPDTDLRDKIFEALDAALSFSPDAVSYIKSSPLQSQLSNWASSNKLTKAQKAQYAPTLKKVGVSV